MSTGNKHNPPQWWLDQINIAPGGVPAAEDGDGISNLNFITHPLSTPKQA
jgi:hypothetical protein